VRRSWQHYAAPAAFLLAVTIAVVLIRAGFESGASTGSAAPRTVAATTGSKPVKGKPTTKFWVVKAGDTFAVISAATGVSVKRIQKLNPKRTSTTLFIGEKVRIR